MYRHTPGEAIFHELSKNVRLLLKISINSTAYQLAAVNRKDTVQNVLGSYEEIIAVEQNAAQNVSNEQMRSNNNIKNNINLKYLDFQWHSPGFHGQLMKHGLYKTKQTVSIQLWQSDMIMITIFLTAVTTKTMATKPLFILPVSGIHNTYWIIQHIL